jgi:polyhydroxyalkanoate synthesis regulator phasin
MASKSKNPSIDPRQLWLAGLGAVSLTRKQAAKAYGVLVEEGTQFRAQAGKRIDAISRQARSDVKNIQSKVAPVLNRANEAYDVVRQQVETRLAPVVALFDKTRKASKSTTRKRVATSKKTVKKAVSRSRSKKAA